MERYLWFSKQRAEYKVVSINHVKTDTHKGLFFLDSPQQGSWDSPNQHLDPLGI